MKALRIAGGIALVLLGSLWCLQGADLIHINPVLCFADCEPLVGGSTTWLVAGLVALAVGALVLTRGRARSGRQPR